MAQTIEMTLIVINVPAFAFALEQAKRKADHGPSWLGGTPEHLQVVLLAATKVEFNAHAGRPRGQDFDEHLRAFCLKPLDKPDIRFHAASLSLRPVC
jgi:hypothetical protein